ncbi:MAG: hypothetical protein QOF24_645 [Verrucomicrobiota bacterium]
MACRVIAGHENDRPLNTGGAQTANAIIKEQLANSLAAISLRHGQVINPSATSIVTA